MFKGHPKGLLVAFFSNMGERFGYYTMLAVFVYYLQAKFGFSSEQAGQYYGSFLFGIYFLPLLGGIIADKVFGYGKTIALGLVVLFLGYVILAIPDRGIGLIIVALTVISLGTGFFKGNLQALVGNMYDDPRYSANRDNAFNIFYMGINIGAFFAPSAARAASNIVLHFKGLIYDPKFIKQAHEVLNDKLVDMTAFQNFAHQYASQVVDMKEFAQTYINAIAQSYNAAFAVAAASMIISLSIFLIFRKHYKSADVTEKQKAKNTELKSQIIELSREETRERFVALGLVFFVVIFFWMAFHQNGFTMSIFARDYTNLQVGNFTYLFFNLGSFLLIIFAILGVILTFNKTISKKIRNISTIVAIACAVSVYFVFLGFSPTMSIKPEQFQQFNPIFIVFLTPVIIGMFTWLRSKNQEPSSPKKIGFGMIITGIGFILLVLASIGLQSPKELNENVSPILRTPYWLIGTYFSLTIAELFLSPMGISFVSKVAPPKYKGLMQGGWLAATALGNLAAGFIGHFWKRLELWEFFIILVVMSWLSATFMFAVLKRLERATQNTAK